MIDTKQWREIIAINKGSRQEEIPNTNLVYKLLEQCLDEIDQLKNSNNEMKEKLDAATDLNMKRFCEIQRLEIKLDMCQMKLDDGGQYVNALIDGMTADEFNTLVDAGKVNGISAWLQLFPDD